MNAITLTAEERLAAKPFTHPAYSRLEARILRYMLVRLCQTIETGSAAKGEALDIWETLESDGRTHRIIVINPQELSSRESFAIVGFFGQRCFDASLDDAEARDKMLFEEMSYHSGLYSYSTLELTNGDYGNCVVFKDEASKNAWGKSWVHEAAVKEFSPRYYHSVRLYNAILPARLLEPEALYLQQVRYFDYAETPPWTAVRTFS